MDGDTWLGSVSLLQNDDERIRQYSPWLASLVVREQARGRGIGRALVARCIEEAKALHVPALYLYCEADLVAYYSALGWREWDMVMLGKLPVAVMAHDVAVPLANDAASAT
jgi:predicted N-acetyltransferase YhbS